MFEPFLDLAERLARAGLLDRRGEFLPTTQEVLARKERSFTRPELAVLMAYSKMQLYHALLESDLPESDAVRSLLLGYFPDADQRAFRQRGARSSPGEGNRRHRHR